MKKTAKKILIVEDSLVDRKLLTELLKGKINYDMATDGEEALKIFKKRKYNLVLLDINLPGLDGMAVLKQLRAYEKEKNINNIINRTPIIILSVFDKFILRPFNPDCDGYVTKPIEIKKLLKKIEDTALCRNLVS